MRKVRAKVTTAKLSGAKKIEFVFSEQSQIANDWIKAVEDQVRKLKVRNLDIAVVVKRLIIHSDGTKSWVIVREIMP